MRRTVVLAAVLALSGCGTAAVHPATSGSATSGSATSGSATSGSAARAPAKHNAPAAFVIAANKACEPMAAASQAAVPDAHDYPRYRAWLIARAALIGRTSAAVVRLQPSGASRRSVRALFGNGPDLSRAQFEDALALLARGARSHDAASYDRGVRAMTALMDHERVRSTGMGALGLTTCQRAFAPPVSSS